MITPAEGRGAFALALLLTAFTPAICEEALFRGPILRGLRTRFSALGAAVLTGLLFGLFHVSVWRLLPTAVLGFALSVDRARRRFDRSGDGCPLRQQRLHHRARERRLRPTRTAR